MTLTLQPVRVAAGNDTDGVLVFCDGALVAILVRLSDFHDDEAGAWFLEVGMGSLDLPNKPVFNDLGAAQKWISAHLDRGRRSQALHT